MRRIAIIAALLIAAPALAMPANSGAASGGAGLRGAQVVAATPTPAPAPPPLLPPPIQSKAPLAFFAANAQPDPQAIQACRLGCAHSYYFCLAGEDAPSCPQNWTSCRADCARNSAPLP